jgi:hypothetical protein
MRAAMSKSPLLLSFLCTFALGLACDPESATVADELASPRVPIKGDAPGSCSASDCGSKASVGSCWCDDLCAQYGDCCADKAPVCDGEEPDEPGPSTVDPVSGEWAFADVNGVPNLDDDDGTTRDWNQYLFASDDDVAAVVLPAEVLAALPQGHGVRLSLTGDTSLVRVWHGGQPRLGSAASSNTFSLTPGGGDIELPVEFGDYNVAAQLRIAHVTPSGSEVEADVIDLRSAPLVLSHHLQPTERVWAVSVNQPGYSNGAFISTYQQVLGSLFTTIPGPSYGNDVWIQDEIEFGTAVGENGERLDIVVDSIRNRGLDAFPEQRLVGPDTIAQTWGVPSQATSYDSFGNLEASPPVTVNGVSYPWGRIYYGSAGGEGISTQLANFLAEQEAQAPFALDTRWLCVGHVDEFSTFIPDPSSPKGFKLLLADTESAYALLAQLPSTMSLPMYGADHGYSTVGQLRNDAALRALNEDLQADELDPIRATFKSRLGLTEADIIDIPTLFEPVAGCGGGTVALTPGMVNLIVANPVGQTPKLFIPDPFFRSNVSNQDSDPVIEYFADVMPAGLELYFVDDWDVYHLGLGEVHCGSNVRRTPTVGWW